MKKQQRNNEQRGKEIEQVATRTTSAKKKCTTTTTTTTKTTTTTTEQRHTATTEKERTKQRIIYSWNRRQPEPIESSREGRLYMYLSKGTQRGTPGRECRHTPPIGRIRPKGALSNVNVNVNVFSHLLSATYKTTSGPLHVSLGILVTCKISVNWGTKYINRYENVALHSLYRMA